MDDPRELMAWDDLGLGSRELAQSIYDDGYRPDMILAIARGGMLVAAAVAYALDVKNTYTMNVEFYTGIDTRLDVPMILPPVPDFVDLQETRILIADDHTLVAEGLRALIAPQCGLEVVGQAADGREALRRALELKPDVAVLDMSMPEMNGIEATHAIRARLPATQVVVVSMHSNPEYVQRALEAGALGVPVHPPADPAPLAPPLPPPAGGRRPSACETAPARPAPAPPRSPPSPPAPPPPPPPRADANCSSARNRRYSATGTTTAASPPR